MKKISKEIDVFKKFEQLKSTVVAQRREFLKKFSHEQLLDYTSQKDVKHWLLEIYDWKIRRIAPESGGMKKNPRALWTKKHVPLAILALHNRNERVTSESIKNELEKYPGSFDEEKNRYIYTDNGIRTALAAFNRDTEKWLIENKQLEA